MSDSYKIQEYQNRFHVTIPAPLARASGLEKGSEVEWEVNDNGNLVIKKVSDE